MIVFGEWSSFISEDYDVYIDYIRTLFATQQDAYKMRVENKTRISAWVFDAAAAAVERYRSTGLRGA